MAGIVISNYEYQRFQTGATPFWTPLRFAGQYHDDETDLNENWNRYYDPQVGRYLQPEPLLSLTANYVAEGSQDRGTLPGPYTYALANPIRFADRNGLGSVIPFDSPDDWIMAPFAVLAIAICAATDCLNNPPVLPAPSLDNSCQSSGERNKAAKPSGTPNPFKKMKPDPNNPNNVIYKDPSTGKQISKPKPPGWDDYWSGRHG